MTLATLKTAMTKKDLPLASLADVREQIDAIDQQIQDLLSQRANCALSVAAIKQAENNKAAESSGKEGVMPDSASQPKVVFYRPEREAQILRRVAERNQGPLSNELVQKIFREIISASLALEEPMQVGYLGPQGTYSESATYKHFGHSVNGVPCSNISEIFSAVDSGQCAYGVVPVENSTEGSVNLTLDLLMETTLRVCGEVHLRIKHQLLSKHASLEEIKAVHAHPQTFAQCRGWLDTHLPQAERISETSNAFAAQIALDGNSVAAIAGESAAEHYALNCLAANIEDSKTNTTRFLIIGDSDIPPSGNDSTSLLISAPHKPGGLRRLLEPFEKAGISMTRIESRPFRGGVWEYVFFIDVQGHQLDESLSPVLEKLKHEAILVRVLGSYPSVL